MHAIGALKSTNPAPQSDSNRHWADFNYVRPDRGNQGKRFAKNPDSPAQSHTRPLPVRLRYGVDTP